jgi:protein SCO1
MKRKRITEASKGVGKAKVGGPFELTDQDGQLFTSEDLKGKYCLVRALLGVICPCSL